MQRNGFDVIVIGAGPVGEVVAERVVAGGLTAVVVESELVGGDCSYWACVPSKVLLRSPAALRAARRVPGAADAVAGGLDVASVLDRRDEFVSGWSDEGQVNWLEEAGIALVRGHGRICGDREVEVVDRDGGRRVLHAHRAVVVATGSASATPPIDGLAEAEPWTSRDATAVARIPSSLAIIGGGAVAAELATAYSAFGCAVTAIARSGLLGSLEPFAGELVAAGLRRQGATVWENAETTRVERIEEGFRLSIADRGPLVTEQLVVATGRRPRTAGLGLETVGVGPEDRLEVDDRMRVGGRDWLYAVGDVTGRVLLTHQGKYQARALGDLLVALADGETPRIRDWERHATTADERAVPQVVFSDPEVASVGMTAAAAREAGIAVRILDEDLGGVAGASIHAEGYEGRARLVVDEGREVVLGATFVGPDVAELLHAATIAVVGEVPLARLRHAVPAFPTMSEVWLRLWEEFDRATHPVVNGRSGVERAR